MINKNKPLEPGYRITRLIKDTDKKRSIDSSDYFGNLLLILFAINVVVYTDALHESHQVFIDIHTGIFASRDNQGPVV